MTNTCLRFASVFAMCCAMQASALRADTIVFKNGEELEGTVLEKDENMIKLQVEYGTVIVPMARVRRVDADTPEQIEEREKKKAAAAELAKEMRAEGKVLYKGKWVTEDEKKEDEDKIAAAKKKKKEEEEAKKKKAEEAAKKAAEDAAKAAETAAKFDTGNSREDRFSRRHGRDGLNSDVLNNNTDSTGSTYQSNTINNNGYRGR